MGPGDMLGLISSETYTTSDRGTCYGLSAAIGKAGAAIGSQAFTPIQLHLGKRWTFIIAAICGVVGVAITYLFMEDLTVRIWVRGIGDLGNILWIMDGMGEMGEDDLKVLVDEVQAGESGVVHENVAAHEK
jgi:MFS family permease